MYVVIDVCMLCDFRTFGKNRNRPKSVLPKIIKQYAFRKNSRLNVNISRHDISSLIKPAKVILFRQNFSLCFR